ncbi:peptidoglycan-recognition protein LE isoform X2 [Linepithema humile]|uniref:peptidoglycan-recognition protein LE isoform X2 n=1 Tax=Linepithema humile TaxID=83485 RepID=UPI00351F38DF
MIYPCSGMVTLVQQQQTSDDDHQCQKEQEHVSVVLPVENHTVDKYQGEVGRLASETVVVVPGNGSVGDSSTQCSDIDDDDDEEETDAEVSGGWLTNLPVPSTIVQQHQAVATANGDVVLPNADPSNFGDVCVKNSTNVHLGNKTFYKGPVTIKQFVYTNPTSIQDEGSCVSDANVSDSSANKNDGTTDRPVLSQNTELNKGVIVDSVRFVERNEWGAQPPSETLTKLKLPVPYVIISHTVTDFCNTQSQCTLHVRVAQTFHIESKKWSDIGYNFLVGGDGLAYVGRSWNYVGAHSFGFNNKSIGISFIGTFNTVLPPKVQLHAAQKIIELGVKGGKIAHNYKLLGHRQVSKTLSPGEALYNEIKTWPHWSPNP